MARLNKPKLPSWHHQRSTTMSVGPDRQSPIVGQRPSDLSLKAPALTLARRTFSGLRCELDNLDTPIKKQRLDQFLSASESIARAASPDTPDACNPLPTTLNWDRTNTQSGGLLDWSMDELHDCWQHEVQAVARAVRGRLTCDQAVVIFVARRYVLLPGLVFKSESLSFL